MKNMRIFPIDRRVRFTENVNSSDIYIRFTETGSPIAYGQSALFLNRYFPEYPFVRVYGPGNEECLIVSDFSLEKVLERFDEHQQLVDDTCIRIMEVV